MSKQLKNKIEATDISIKGLLEDEKFFIDYFQREYRWQEKHIKLLVEDLTTTFLKSYEEGQKRSEVANYQNYYLGPVVFSNAIEGKNSIIDGQQRITSITLLLIYLNHLQASHESKVEISKLIFSEKYGEKSFNMTDEEREPCLRSLFETGSYTLQEADDETIVNMVERYQDIVDSFPEEITTTALPYFIDWFIENVVIVKITAYSEENAYTIFETMNDRGLNLTPTEMLKGFVLSRITDKDQRNGINELWKLQIQKLHVYSETTDQSFFHAWFRGRYAESIRPGKANSENQDYEIIGTRFHNWFKENHRSHFSLNSSDDFYTFFKNEFPFYVSLYLKILQSKKTAIADIPHLYYIQYWGIAESLQDPLLLSSINFDDDDSQVAEKMDAVARYIETFTVKRSVNYKKFGQTSIKYTMFNLIKAIRSKEVPALLAILNEGISEMDQTWEKVADFGLHKQNGRFVKHLLSRISSYLDQQVGKDSSYASYHHPNGKPFEIEHLWADKFEEHRDEFDQQGDFSIWRNKIGALVLLPNGTNQSYNSDKYTDKVDHYVKENTYVQTLTEKYYEKNPNFLKSENISQLGFRAYPNMKKNDIIDRQVLVQRICEQIWSTDYFSKNDHNN